VPLYIGTVDASGDLTLPDAVPQAKIFTGTTFIESKLVPVEDRYVLTGWFRATLFLGHLYSPGFYTVVYYYSTGSGAFNGLATDNFEIVPGGDARGAVIGTYFYARPEANYIVQGLESGSIIKGRNPTVGVTSLNCTACGICNAWKRMANCDGVVVSLTASPTPAWTISLAAPSLTTLAPSHR